MDVGNPGCTIPIRAVADHASFVIKAVRGSKKSFVTFVRRQALKDTL
jgi:hypothetical protein